MKRAARREVQISSCEFPGCAGDEAVAGSAHCECNRTSNAPPFDTQPPYFLSQQADTATMPMEKQARATGRAHFAKTLAALIS
jgi:hypothetical protein